MDLYDLKVRTKARESWKEISPIPYMGISDSIDETSLDLMNRNLIQTVVDIVDDEFRIKEEQLLLTFNLEYDKLETERIIALDKATTQRTILAMTVATNAYILTVEHYIISVKNLLMDAQEYAFVIEQKRIPLGLLQAELAEEKAALKIASLEMKIELEALNKKFAEVEVLKAELNSAKADVRLVLAEVAIEEARLNEVEARVELAMTDVEKAKLTADIAMVFAEIAVRQLTKIKFDVESAEIQAEFVRIAEKLASVLAILGLKQSQLSEQRNLQLTLFGDIATLLIAKKDYVDVGEEEAQTNLLVKAYETGATAHMLGVESGLKESLLQSKISLENQRSAGSLMLDAAALAAEAITKSYDSETRSFPDSQLTSQATIARAISRG